MIDVLTLSEVYYNLFFSNLKSTFLLDLKKYEKVFFNPKNTISFDFSCKKIKDMRGNNEYQIKNNNKTQLIKNITMQTTSRVIFVFIINSQSFIYSSLKSTLRFFAELKLSKLRQGFTRYIFGHIFGGHIFGHIFSGHIFSGHICSLFLGRLWLNVRWVFPLLLRHLLFCILCSYRFVFLFIFLVIFLFCLLFILLFIAFSLIQYLSLLNPLSLFTWSQSPPLL